MPAKGLDLSAPRVPLAIIVMGAHGAFADLTFTLIEELARVAGKGTLRVDRFDAIDFSIDPQRILLCNYPSNQIVEAIAREDLKVLLLTEPSADTLRFMVRALAIEPLEAIRSQTASAVAYLAIGRSGSVEQIERTKASSLLGLSQLLAGNLGLGLSLAQLLGPAERLSGGLGCEANVESILAQRAERWGKLSDTVGRRTETGRAWTEVCHDVLDGVLAMARFGSLRPIVWPTEVFTISAPRVPGRPADVLLAGPSRNVYYGPYFYLPPARYRVEVFIIFSAEATQVPFSIELHAGAWLSRATIDHWRPGQFRGAFQLVHSDATSSVEIRLRNLAEVTAGSLSLIEILFVPEQNGVDKI